MSAAISTLLATGKLRGRVWLSYGNWRTLRIEAGCEDPGPPPDGYDEHSLVIVSETEARLAGDDAP